MTLLYTEVEEELRASVRDLLADRCRPDAVLRRAESASPYDAELAGLWRTLARDIGVAGLLVPEEYGGAGASAREAAVVLEELGRAVAPVPFLTSAVLATEALVQAGTPALREGAAAGPGAGNPASPSGGTPAGLREGIPAGLQEETPAGSGEGLSAGGRDLLAELAAGETTAALAVSLAASPYRPLPPAVTLNDAGTLDGEVRAVAGADAADVLLVPVGTALYLVRAGDARIDVVPSLDLTRPIAVVTLSGAPGERVGAFDARRVLASGAGLLASEQLGVAEWCFETTLAHIRERHQFARPIGSFQAIKHRMADLWLDVARARAAARNAANLLAARPAPGTEAALEAGAATAVAKSWCSEVAVRVAEEGVQLHGGTGMTWEHPLHLYLKRAKTSETVLGTPGAHRDALSALADLPGPI
ncbi:acyl-CoA dehydrogenase family protein [Streptosporangium sp. NPDC048047]|uniref:acyl-CoA dehydrogenase family protein n=1 Tax=Streptosporangium sp. NPDC048047 TaxID=3155748 RepID=UPI003415440E